MSSILKKTHASSFFLSLACLSGMFVFVGFLLWAPQTKAANGINRQMTYQARLMDSSGVLVADAAYSLKLSLYDAASGGNRLWTATGTVATPTALPVSVANGLLTVLLGDTSASGGWQNALDDTIDWNSSTLFLGVTVGSDSEMTPRRRLTAVPQAFNAEKLQGMYASSTAYGGNSLFVIHQTTANNATSSRSALDVRTEGTSNATDFILRGFNSAASAVFSINRFGSVTSTGLLAVTGSGTSTFSDSLVASGNVSSTNLFATLGTITQGLFNHVTSTEWLGFTTANGTALTVSQITGGGLAGPGTIDSMSIGNTTPATAIFTNATSTNATSTAFFATNFSFTNATGTNVSSTNLAITGSGTSTFNGSIRALNNVSSTNLFAMRGTFTHVTSTNVSSTYANFNNLTVTTCTGCTTPGAAILASDQTFTGLNTFSATTTMATTTFMNSIFGLGVQGNTPPGNNN
ncbi:hypothetical protein EXS71_02345, partial [Candidatus Uhrbacteria bacterium]|nr:hypothetical protein [Candidatus Uhrbacteria bacterium]